MAFNIATRPEDTVTWSIIILIIALVRNNLKYGLYLLILLPVLGEFGRLPFGPENGMLASDLAVLIYLAVWIFQKITSGQKIPRTDLNKPLAAFFTIAALSLIYALTFLQSTEVIISSMYLVRLIGYVSVFLITVDILKKSANPERDRTQIIRAILAAAFLICIAGFIQLVIYPNLTALEEYGWDPHMGRLVSTWLDPNFIGGYLSFVIAISLSLFFDSKKLTPKLGYLALTIIYAAALFLTYSRSAYLALAAVIIIIGLLRSWKLLAISALIFIIALTTVPRVAERMGELTQSITSITGQSAENPDPTARLRLKAYEQTWELIGKRPLLGSGYNTLRYVNYNEGYVTDTTIHSASGSDSSLLTILATTGFAGLIAFIWMIFLLLKQNWKNLRTQSKKTRAAIDIKRSKAPAPLRQTLSLALFSGFIALLIHSLFVNSLLFAQIMIPLWISIGLIQKDQ
ncbi:O-antigen ligase family protein [Candidatus Gracilibacteria bacterium]|nr:O-antigen ligase family protein [Candidatus Gracilibacteria bacterium]